MTTAKKPRRRNESATSRLQLLCAAKDVFEQQGFLAARITDISHRAGFSHGLFYSHFRSKIDVFRQLAEEIDHRLTASIKLRFPADQEFGGIWHSVVATFFSNYQKEFKILRVIGEVSHYDTEIHERRARERRREQQLLSHGIAKLQINGLADPDLDPHLAALLIGTLAWSFAEQCLVSGSFEGGMKVTVEQFTRLVFNALKYRAEP